MDPPGGVFGVVGSDDGLRGMGGGALLGDFVGGGAGAASFAMRAAMAEALPEDLGVFAAAFSFLAASSLAFALAIISATPIFCCRATAL